MAVSLRFLSRFDRAKWEIAESKLPALLVTWDEQPPAADSGMPAALQDAAARALARLGLCFFAHASPAARLARQTFRVRRGLSFKKLTAAAAREPQDIRLAFDAAGHDWTQGAQWIVLARPGSELGAAGVAELLGSLYGPWELPAALPASVLAVIQAAVDGDGFGISAASAGILDDVRSALAEEAARAGIAAD